MKTHIIGAYTYQYQSKTWMLFNEYGHVVQTYSAGGKLSCLKEGIRRQYSDIYQAACTAVSRQPKAEGFIWRSAELLANGHVYEARAENQINEVARVRSTSFDPNKPFDPTGGYDREGFFSIQKEGFLMCQCGSYYSEYGPTTIDNWKLCKHTMAVMLAKASDTPLRVVRTADILSDIVGDIPLNEFNEMLFA